MWSWKICHKPVFRSPFGVWVARFPGVAHPTRADSTLVLYWGKWARWISPSLRTESIPFPTPWILSRSTMLKFDAGYVAKKLNLAAA